MLHYKPADRLPSGCHASKVQRAGPIPPPHFLREYDEIVPGAAERILSLAEDQTRHRIALEKQAMTSNIRRSWGGLASGFTIGMTTISFGGYGMLHGQQVYGFLLGVAGLAAIVAVFIVGHQKTSAERAEKSKAMKRK